MSQVWWATYSQVQSDKAAKLTADKKDMVASLYLAWEDRSWAQQDFVDLFSDAGFAFDPRTIGRWTKRKRQGETPISDTKASGRPTSLSDDHVHCQQNPLEPSFHLMRRSPCIRTTSQNGGRQAISLICSITSIASMVVDGTSTRKLGRQKDLVPSSVVWPSLGF